jgi:hypothetical protein
MHSGRGPGGFFRRIGFFALIGFAVLFLSAPIIALVSAVISLVLVVVSFVLPFALIGFLVWLPLRGFRNGAGAAWKDLRAGSEVIHGTIQSASRLATSMTGKVVQTGNGLISAAHEKAHFVGIVLLEILSGTLVGVLFGSILQFHHPIEWEPVALCGAIGATLGTLVAISRARFYGRHATQEKPVTPI